MERRYALRFENGERQGETVPIAGPSASVGRRPGNTIQILDASVSGKHAEFVVEEGGVRVRDLGSTNGTRVGKQRISEHPLAHGDEVFLGNVRLRLIDASLESAPPAPAGAARPGGGNAADAGEGVQTISADAIERTRGKRSRLTWILMAAVLAVGGGAFFWLRSRGGGGAAKAARPVEVVAGNLLGEASFEDGAAGWSAVEQGPSGFGVDPGAARSGEVGVSAEVLADEWAEHRSPAVRVPRARALEVQGWVRSEAAQGRLGVVFEDSTGAARPLVVWSDPAEADAGFDPVAMTVDVPPGYDTARAALHAAPADPPVDGGGSVEVDDVSLVPVERVGSPASLGEFELSLLGQPPTVGVLFKIDRVLISGLRAARAASEDRADRARLATQVGEDGIRIEPSGGETIAFYVEPALAALGVASVGDGGYTAHTTGFTRDGATALLAGNGRDLVRLGFDGPVTIVGKPDAEGFLIQVSPVAAFDLQLSFRAERNTAQDIARDAREAEQAGRPGEAISLWGRVLDEAPFEDVLVHEAEGTRSRLVDAGLSEVRELSKRLERARFFRLVDIFRRARERADDIAERYASSEVEQVARDLATQVDAELSVLEADLDRHEKARLEAIARTLEAGDSPKLAERVNAYLTARFGTQGSGGGGD